LFIVTAPMSENKPRGLPQTRKKTGKERIKKIPSAQQKREKKKKVTQRVKNKTTEKNKQKRRGGENGL